MLKSYKILTGLLMILSLHASGQADLSERIRTNFLQYCNNVPWEDIYVHTDREEYISGEHMWFKVYLVDRQSGLSTSHSTLVYFELLDFDHHPVVRERIRIENGSGPGHIILPDTLKSGNYSIRAYTNWMKNFMPSACYTHTIDIYNSIDPENFHLNTESKVIREENRTEKGMNLIVDNGDPENLSLKIQTDEEFRMRNSNLSSLFIHTHGIINFSGPVYLTDDITLKLIPKKLLSNGINHITIFSGDGMPLAEKFIYTPEKLISDIPSKTKDIISTREKVIISDTELLSCACPSDLSMSVAGLYTGKKTIDLDDYLVFGSEFGCQIQESLKGRKLNEMDNSEIDSLLNTVKSGWIDWPRIISGNTSGLKYKPEQNEHFLTGSLISGDSEHSVSGQKVIFSVPGKVALFQYSVTDDAGNFVFSLSEEDVLKDIVVQPENFDGAYSIKIGSSYYEVYPENAATETRLDSIPSSLRRCTVNYQVSKIYGIQPLSDGMMSIPVEKHKRFYGKPDLELKLDDYIKLPLMEEIFFELIPGVFLKNRRSHWEITIIDPVTGLFHDDPPALFIDGVKISDAGVIADLDPEKVEKIDVVRNSYLVGDYLFNGLINVITRAGDLSITDAPDYALRTNYRVVEPVNLFKSPEYSSENMKKDRVPDFRNTLYWNPHVTPESGELVEFWTSDKGGDFEIKLEGFDSAGRPITVRKILHVMNKE